jgi:hypothetical protein
VAQSHTPNDHCVRFAVVVTFLDATLVTRRALPITWAGLSPAGSRQLRLAHCYAFAGKDFLEDELQQLYWRTDIAQMTRYYIIEAVRSGIRLSHAAPGSQCSVGCVLALIFGWSEPGNSMS